MFHQIPIFRGSAPDPAGELKRSPNPVAGGAGLAAPLQEPHPPLSTLPREW